MDTDAGNGDRAVFAIESGRYAFESQLVPQER